MKHFSRRKFAELAGIAMASCGAGSTEAEADSQSAVRLFDGKTLDGWTEIENSFWSISAAAIADPQTLVRKTLIDQDPVSTVLRDGLTESRKADLAAYSPSGANAKDVVSALVKDINQIIAEQQLSETKQRPTHSRPRAVVKTAPWPARAQAVESFTPATTMAGSA